MRVAILNHAGLSGPGGAESWVRRVTAYLVTRHHSVDIIVPYDEDIAPAIVPGGAREIVIRSKLYSGLKGLGLLGFAAPLFNPKLNDSYDLIYSTSFFPLLFFLRAKAPLIVGTHDAFIPNSRLGVDSFQLIPRVGLRALSAARRLTVHTLNPRSSAAFRRWGFNVVEVPLDFMLSERQPQPRLEDRFRVLYLGLVDPRKGGKELVAVANLIQRWPRLSLTIAGHVDSRFSSAIGYLSKRAQVNVLGYVDEARKRSLLSQSDLGLFLSNREVSPIVPRELLASGIPIVSTWEPLADVTSSSGVRTVARNPESIASGIESLYSWWVSDPTEYLSFRKTVQDQFLASHDPTASAESTVSMFEQVGG